MCRAAGLLLVMSCAAGCGGPRSDPNGRPAAEWVLGRGGAVTIAEAEYPIKKGGKLPEGRISVLKVDLNEKAVTDAELEKLAGLTNIVSLSLHGAKLTDKGLDQITGMRTLEDVELSYTRITNEGLTKLAAMPKLKKVFVYGTRVTADGAKSFQQSRPGCIVLRDVRPGEQK